MIAVSAPRSRTAVRWLLAVAALAFVGLRIPYLSLPLERDEGEYAYIAQRIPAGEIPYRDAFDQKPPGAFAFYLAAVAATGTSAVGLHAFAGLWSALTALLLFWLVRRLAGALAAGFAVLLFALFSTDPRLFATAANTEQLMLLPLVASSACLLRASEGPRRAWAWWLACGALAGVAAWFKQVAVLQGLFAAAVAGVAWGAARPRPPWTQLAARLAWLAAGAALAWAPLLALFAGLGAWRPFVDAVLLYNLDYSGDVGLAGGANALLAAVATQTPSFALAWALAAVALGAPALAGRRAWAFLGGWWLFSCAGVAVGLYFRPHYFLQLLPALCGLAGLALGAAARALLARRSPAAAWGGFAALLALALAPPLAANAPYLAAPGRVARARAIYGYNPFPEAETVADYIRNTSAPDDAVFVLGSEPEILFLAERPSATRYIFVYPLTSGLPGDLERQREAMREVREHRPLYVVWVQMQSSLLLRQQTESYLFTETIRLLRRGYRLEFVAQPDAPDGPFAFHYGGEAPPVLDRLLQDPSSPAWLAVWRRAH